MEGWLFGKEYSLVSFSLGEVVQETRFCDLFHSAPKWGRLSSRKVEGVPRTP